MTTLKEKYGKIKTSVFKQNAEFCQMLLDVPKQPNTRSYLALFFMGILMFSLHFGQTKQVTKLMQKQQCWVFYWDYLNWLHGRVIIWSFWVMSCCCILALWQRSYQSCNRIYCILYIFSFKGRLLLKSFNFFFASMLNFFFRVEPGWMNQLLFWSLIHIVIC